MTPKNSLEFLTMCLTLAIVKMVNGEPFSSDLSLYLTFQNIENIADVN